MELSSPSSDAHADVTPNRAEIELLRSQIATLSQLLEVQERTTIEHARRLEETFRELRETRQELVGRNSQLQEQAVELEAQNEELQATSEELESQTETLEEARASAQALVERFRAMFATATLGMAITDARTGQFLEVNPAYARITAYTADELRAMDFSSITHPDDRSANAHGIERLIAGAIPSFVIEKRYMRKDAGIVWVRNNVSITRDPAGNPVNVIALTEDVTDRKHAEEQRVAAVQRAEEARAAAEAANLAKSQFLASMSHELRTPLNAIGGHADLIEEGIYGPVTPRQSEALARIRRSAQHLLGLINDILNFARIGAGKVQYSIRPLPTSSLVSDVEGMAVPQMQKRGIEFTSVKCDPPLVALGDPEKARQIVLNLLTNATKFTDPGGRISMDCTALPPADDTGTGFVAIRVHDTGIGIAPDKLSAIFDPFVQVDAGLRRTNEGVGLGLAISRDLAKGMGGDLTVESTVGVGSTFTLKLPRAPERKSAARPEAAASTQM